MQVDIGTLADVVGWGIAILLGYGCLRLAFVIISRIEGDLHDGE